MKTADPGYEILTDIKNTDFLSQIELAARTCYKSEDYIKLGSAEKMVKFIIDKGHEAMIEHAPNISVRFRANRGFTHEIVRMRLASFGQESTRWVNYAKEKFGSEITVCTPQYIKDLSPEVQAEFLRTWEITQNSYMALREKGVPAQIARDVLPIGIKADIVVTSNVRHWRHMLNLRAADAAGKAHPIMHELMRPLCKELQAYIPILFDDITWEE